MTTTPTTTATPVTVRPLPAGWTPPADWERHTIAINPGTPDSAREPAGYQAGVSYVLDIERRELTVHPVASGADAAAVPGTYVSPEKLRSGVVPPVIQLGGVHLAQSASLATPDFVNGLFDEVQPLAQQIVDNLLPVAGTTGYDWTALAADALAAAEHLLNRRPYRGTEYDYPYTVGAYAVDAADALAAWPDLIDTAWAQATDQELQNAAAALYDRLSGRPDSDVPARMIKISLTGSPLPDFHGRAVTSVRLYGARAWLHAYRRDQAGGLTPVDATRWDGAAHHAPRITDDSTAEDLAATARQAERDAATQGIKLIGADRWAAALRADRRTAVRSHLAELRDQIAYLENDLKPARRRRAALVTRVLAWGEEDTDSGLGRAAGLSHTAIRTIRTSLDAEDTDPDQ
ncbi:MAG: hypothetical protein LBV60_24295 [Streptomyces sp.]|jgi:hypothetical protein|nr:hypothetical protein [Streptomyces sp.]